ncbi:hypothetical protein WMZ97_18790 [Lentibacillus sp. N15]|uniref:hypothetical protein n=1 Tax=Lentibacillus songyuanensis TaxID=3136161 RepID=UPI0031BB6C6A
MSVRTAKPFDNEELSPEWIALLKEVIDRELVRKIFASFQMKKLKNGEIIPR